MMVFFIGCSSETVKQKTEEKVLFSVIIKKDYILLSIPTQVIL